MPVSISISTSASYVPAAFVKIGTAMRKNPCKQLKQKVWLPGIDAIRTLGEVPDVFATVSTGAADLEGEAVLARNIECGRGRHFRLN
jgi:hypothetical protein